MKYQPDPRKKRRNHELNTSDQSEYAKKLLEKFSNGEEMKPDGKAPSGRPLKQRTLGLFSDHVKGVCSGCHQELLRAPDGRTFHRAGVSTNCKYGTPDFHKEVNHGNHTIKITSGGISKTISIFEWFVQPEPDTLQMNVPEWCFFDMEFV